MADPVHIYQKIPLFWSGLVLGAVLIAVHLTFLLKADWSKAWLTRLPRHRQAGIFMMSIGMIWFWLLVAPEIRGTFSWLGSLGADLGEFEGAKKYLQLGVPLALIGMVLLVPEFLFVRGLGLVLLMAGAPLLFSAFLKEPSTRLLVPIYAYTIIIAGLYFVGMPYLFRDLASWAVAKDSRWRVISMAGLIYGIATFGCALLFWRGH